MIIRGMNLPLIIACIAIILALIVLPLIVAENEKILDDREKLKLLSEKKFTSDLEKQWLRQKLLEYKVKKGDTLGQIAEDYKTNASKIRRWNRLKYGSSLIYPGQKLKIWVKEG